MKTTDAIKSNTNNLLDDIIEIKSDHGNEGNPLDDFLLLATTDKESEHGPVNPVDADLFSVSEYTDSTLEDKPNIAATENISNFVSDIPPTVEQIEKSSPPLLPNFILGPIKEPEQFNVQVSTL